MPTMVRLILLVIVVAVIGWSIHQAQIRRAQGRLRQLGQQLQSRGIGFADWLAAAGLHETDLRDRRRRDEVQARLIHTAARLLGH
jgi:type II secretory pathway pseudopilin PulG